MEFLSIFSFLGFCFAFSFLPSFLAPVTQLRNGQISWDSALSLELGKRRSPRRVGTSPSSPLIPPLLCQVLGSPRRSAAGRAGAEPDKGASGPWGVLQGLAGA